RSVSVGPLDLNRGEIAHIDPVPLLTVSYSANLVDSSEHLTHLYDEVAEILNALCRFPGPHLLTEPSSVVVEGLYRAVDHLCIVRVARDKSVSKFLHFLSPPPRGESGAGVTNPKPAGLPRRTPRALFYLQYILCMH